MAKDKAVVPETKAAEDPKPVVVEDVAAEAKAAVVHEDEVAAIKDSRKRNLPIFKAVDGDTEMWIVAVSEHQAKFALIDRVWPLWKLSKKDRDCRYLHLLEAKDDAATTE